MLLAIVFQGDVDCGTTDSTNQRSQQPHNYFPKHLRFLQATHSVLNGKPNKGEIRISYETSSRVLNTGHPRLIHE